MIPRGATQPPMTSLDGLVSELDGSKVRGGNGTLGGVWCGGPQLRPTGTRGTKGSLPSNGRPRLMLHEDGRGERRDEERARLLRELGLEDDIVVRGLLDVVQLELALHGVGQADRLTGVTPVEEITSDSASRSRSGRPCRRAHHDQPGIWSGPPFAKVRRRWISAAVPIRKRATSVGSRAARGSARRPLDLGPASA